MGSMEKLFGQLEGIKAWFYTQAMSTGVFQPKLFLLLIDILQMDNQKISLAYNFKIQLLLDLSTWKRIKMLERAFFVHGNAVTLFDATWEFVPHGYASNRFGCHKRLDYLWIAREA